MANISYDLPSTAFSALRLSPKEFAQEMRIAACGVQPPSKSR